MWNIYNTKSYLTRFYNNFYKDFIVDHINISREKPHLVVCKIFHFQENNTLRMSVLNPLNKLQSQVVQTKPSNIQ